jgi:hypothetical protein
MCKSAGPLRSILPRVIVSPFLCEVVEMQLEQAEVFPANIEELPSGGPRQRVY